MAIDINNGFSPLAQNNRKSTGVEAEDVAKRRGSAGESSPAGSDEVKISADANSLRAMQSRLESQESFDEARVTEIRNAIAEGRYPIDNQRLAEKFLQLESKL